MRSMLISLLATALAAMAVGQSPPPSAAGAESGSPADKTSMAQIAAGGTIVAELAKPVDARKAKADDKIEARLTMDVLSHGKVTIRRGAKIMGHVTDAKAGVKQAPASLVEIAFDRIVLKGGREIPLKATIQAVGAPLQVSPVSSESISDASNGMPGVGGNMPDGMGGTGRNGTSVYPPRPTGLERPADNGGPNGTQAPPLGPTSQGVVGMKGISLSTTARGSAISSATENIRLGSGTQLVLRVTKP